MRRDWPFRRILIVTGASTPLAGVDALTQAAQARGARVRVVDRAALGHVRATSALARGLRWCDLVHIRVPAVATDVARWGQGLMAGIAARAIGRSTVIDIDEPNPPYEAIEPWRAFAARSELAAFESILCRHVELAAGLKRIGARPTRVVVTAGLDANAILDQYPRRAHPPRPETRLKEPS